MLAALYYKDVQTIDGQKDVVKDNGSMQHQYSPNSMAQAGAMTDRQALRVHQIRERGKQMDHKYLTEVAEQRHCHIYNTCDA